ncbi:hypothetical protein Ddye_026781 [Dipteronia dyeriana]|uniref:Uncharacterized protein n=1 Tax=Dipteronia dyeriana TaxID=168575 RepID=A0AAD9WPV5_9ROSI|nr:hypothetical protein Ddye_026781 [Dipteronia dyeriana]
MLDHVDELELVESVHNNNGSCEVEEANACDLLSKGKGDRLSVSPQLPNEARGASDGMEKPDSSSDSSPQDQREGRIPDVSPEPAQSPASFRRSRSRQRALELRNSAEADRSQLHVDNNTGLFATENTGSEIAPLMLDHVDELELVESVHNNNGSCEVEANLGDLLSKGKGSRKEELISCPLLPGSQPATLFSISDLVPYKNQLLYLKMRSYLLEITQTSQQMDDLIYFNCLFMMLVVSQIVFLSWNLVLHLHKIREIQQFQTLTQPFQSLAMIQRSKSRKQALELRYSAKAAKSCLYIENDTNSQQPSSLRESSCMGDPTSVGRSSQGGKSVDRSISSRELIEEDLSCLRSFGSVGVGSCPQQVWRSNN